MIDEIWGWVPKRGHWNTGWDSGLANTRYISLRFAVHISHLFIFSLCSDILCNVSDQCELVLDLAVLITCAYLATIIDQ